LHYFAQSPFFDPTSNNAILIGQAQFNPAIHAALQTRESFEARLQSMQGLEFVLSHEPTLQQPPGPSESGNIWIIRKQMRRKKQGYPDEVTSLASFFIVGENVYMAPSVGKIIASRLLSTVSALNKIQASVNDLATFSSVYGSTYFANDFRPVKTAPASLRTSKESTPMPGLKAQSQSALHPIASKDISTQQKALTSTRLLLESLNIYSRYSEEYTDVNPLIGEPGNFQVAHTASFNSSQARSLQPIQTSQSTGKADAKSPTSPTMKGGDITTKKGGSRDATMNGPPKPKRRKSSKAVISNKS
jgi:mediator of RNA polymerase II transcription subunit 6